MVDEDDKNGRYPAETRSEKLLKGLHIDKAHITASRSPQCSQWKITMILLTAVLSSRIVVPYIHLNATGSKLGNNSQWIFPVVRAIGGFLPVTTMQLLIQRRIATLAQTYLENRGLPLVSNDIAQHNDRADASQGSDLKKGEVAVGTTNDSVGVTWILMLLLLGIFAPVVGFSVVQNAVSFSGPLS